MSKMLKRVTAVAGVAVIGVASLAGCSSSAKKASSMFEVMGAVSDMEKYTYEITTSIKSSDIEYEVLVYGECDGNATTMSFEIEAEDKDTKVEDFIIATQDVIYVNVESVAALITASDEGSFDLGAYGITGDWISIELPEDYEQPDVDLSGVIDDLDETYSEFVTEKDGKFVLEIADDEVLKKFIDTTVDFIDSNSEQWSKDIADAYTEMDLEKMIRDYASDIMNDINESFELGATEEEINEYIDEAIAEMELSEMEVSASEIKEGLNELKEELADAKEDATLDGSEIKITAYQDGKTYVTKAEVATYEDDEKSAFEYSMVITEDSSVKVEVPSEKIQSFTDVIGSVIDSMGLDQYVDDALDNMAGMDIYDDFGSEYDDDDFSSIFDDDFDSEFDDEEDEDEFDMYEDDLDDYMSDLWD